jgi:hypothetical protein
MIMRRSPSAFKNRFAVAPILRYKGAPAEGFAQRGAAVITGRERRRHRSIAYIACGG